MPRALLATAVLALLLPSCRQLDVRLEIKAANEAYLQQNYATALAHYQAARKLDSSFVDLDRLIGYSYIGLFEPENLASANQQNAIRAIESLKRYLAVRPEDHAAEDTLVAFYLSADRTEDALAFYESHLKKNPRDLDAAKSIATLYAKAGDFPGATRWYREITKLDAKNPEAFYIYGVVLYEKVAKNPDPDPVADLRTIEEGKAALARALELRPEYFEALVYTNLLWREQAERAPDEKTKLDLIYEAEQFRNRAIAVAEARKKAAAAVAR